MNGVPMGQCFSFGNNKYLTFSGYDSLCWIVNKHIKLIPESILIFNDHSDKSFNNKGMWIS